MVKEKVENERMRYWSNDGGEEERRGRSRRIRRGD